MIFTDSHTHVYAEEFDGDRSAVIHRAAESGVSRLLLPAIDSKHHEKMLNTVRQFSGQCLPMMGLHPTSVKKDFAEELKIVGDYLSDSKLKFCAVGEIGLDFYWDRTYEAEQNEAFVRQLEMAIELDLPVVIHTRNSMDKALSIIEGLNNPKIRGVFHCFSGNPVQARQAIALGFLIGIGGVITYKNSSLRSIVETTGMEHLLLETDAPWLPPVPYRGQRNEPSYIPLIARKIAELKNLDREEVAEKTTENAGKLFGI